MIEWPLTKDQQTVFDLIENTNQNVFVGGKPGVGKTVLVRALDELGKKLYTKAAPTGLAALNMGGKTLNSVFGIAPMEWFPRDYDNWPKNENVQKFLRFTVKHLIIDEISMVRSDFLDFVDRILRHFKDRDEPFGGIQVIVVGDFFQLPPIVDKLTMGKMNADGWKTEFAFSANCFSTFVPYFLTEVLRQKGDDKFIKVLHEARLGGDNLSDASLKLLNARVQRCGDLRMRLCGKNKEAEAINLNHMAELETPEVEFSADSYGSWPEFPADTIVTLKVGTQVLVKVNGADKKPGTKGTSGTVVNGSLGEIVEINEQAEAPNVVIRLRDGRQVPIYRNRWERVERKKNDEGVWEEEVVASFTQIPLQLAWAMSIHKSQGQTYEAVHVNPASIFAAGQLYVALSRSKSLAGLTLESRVDRELFWARPSVIQKMREYEDQSSIRKSTATLNSRKGRKKVAVR